MATVAILPPLDASLATFRSDFSAIGHHARRLLRLCIPVHAVPSSSFPIVERGHHQGSQIGLEHQPGGGRGGLPRLASSAQSNLDQVNHCRRSLGAEGAAHSGLLWISLRARRLLCPEPCRHSSWSQMMCLVLRLERFPGSERSGSTLAVLACVRRRACSQTATGFSSAPPLWPKRSGVAQSVAQMVTTRQDTLGQRVAQIWKTSAIKRVLGSVPSKQSVDGSNPSGGV